jgi:hypothetical protein
MREEQLSAPALFNALRGARSAIHHVCEQPIRDLSPGRGSAQHPVSGAPEKRLDVREVRKYLPPLCRGPSEGEFVSAGEALARGAAGAARAQPV